MHIINKGQKRHGKPANLRVNGYTISVSSRLQEMISHHDGQSVFIATDEESVWVASLDHDGGYTVSVNTITSTRVPRLMRESGHATDGTRYYPTGTTRDAEIDDGVVATFHQLKAHA